MPLTAGAHLAPYEILARIGAGGMGEVYKARDPRLGRLVAIKILAAEKVADPIRKQRFFQEARAVSALNHPNIVIIHDISEDNQTDYLVMELVAGKTLEEAIPRSGLRLGDVLQYGIQIADALAAAHAAGIMHRDIKPSNVMIAESGRIKVLDFGLAKLVEEQQLGLDESTRTALAQTADGMVVGSVPYMSPEQAEGKPLDARTDIFSVGALLYEMCTGARAFSGESRASTLAAVIAKDPAPMQELAPDMPAELERVILRCLRKDPNRRFQSMRDLALTLEELKTESDSGRLAETREHAVRPAKRRRIALAATLAGIALAAGAAWLWWSLHHDRPVGPLALEPITFDSGLTTDPAISPDGKLIAYASDRAGEGNLDIWVQYRGGEPVRITHNPADEYEPSFSPDGTQILYRSDQDGGGIYVASSLGGGQPRLVTSGAGGRPRFSPDGREILFGNLSLIAQYAFTLNVTVPGSPRRQLAPEFLAVLMPVWSPDGQHIMFVGARLQGNATQTGLWVIPRNGGPAEPVQLSAGLEVSQVRQAALDEWLSGDRILGEIERAGRVHLWQARLRRNPWRLDRIEQLTFGTGSAHRPSAARDGTLVLSSEETDLDLWSLAFDARQGKLTGDPQRLTQDAAREAFPSISTDGTKLAYSAEQADRSHIWVMDLPSGTRRMLTDSPSFDRRPAITMDGSMIAYLSQAAGSGQSGFVIPTSGGPPRKIDGAKAVIWDWSSDGRSVLVASANGTTASVALADIGSNAVAPFLRRSHNVFQSHMSHDGHWAIAQEAGGVGVLLAPVVEGKPPAEDAWQPLGLKNADLIRWSPDDTAIYFVSGRDAFRCIWGQRLDPRTKRISGEPFPVAHFHQARRSLRVFDSGEIGLAVARDKIVIAEAEKTGNVWMARLDN
jgi:Tol biopolymer transport system component/tRNA A-37 threonylcarbamoyl transferase component Bud32